MARQRTTKTGDARPRDASSVPTTEESQPVAITGDIDERMDALLKDHQAMGARPAEEPTTEEPDK